MDTSRKLLNMAEAAGVLGLSRSLLYELVMRGELQSITIGRARRIPVTALDDFIAQRLADSSQVGGSVRTNTILSR